MIDGKQPALLDRDNRSFRYVIGIDLGTTNSAVAYVDLKAGRSASGQRRIQFFPVPQLVAPAEIDERSVLPSFLYLPGTYDLPAGSAALPWDSERQFITGEFAREQGAKVPGRLIASAKSWLCHAGVNRNAPILPWNGPEDLQRLSPVEASSRYLQHIREAWDQQIGGTDEGERFEDQLIVLTVPASFDEMARELTLSAARAGGMPRTILLEEPLAAFYAWLSRNERDWQQNMSDGQLILVCDVGGGTTDFSIVGIQSGEEGLRFNRLAVGEHLMLGGDNMDLALAKFAEGEFQQQSQKIDQRQWHQLAYQCRRAKERLLGHKDPEAGQDITLIGAAGKLIAGTLKTTITQAQVQRIIVDGFFPQVALNDTPAGGRRQGLSEMGLPYVQDPAVTRHLAAFWSRFQPLLQQETGREATYPDYVLYNGGVLTPGSIRAHLSGVVGSWFKEQTDASWLPEELDNPHPELAVAVGAAYYGLVRAGEGVRIGSGSPRTFYLALDGAQEEKAPRSAVCLLPRGTEEGYEIELTDPEFALKANQPVSFQLTSSSTRLGDKLGDLVSLDPDETSEMPPIQTVLRFGKKSEAKEIPVRIVMRLTAIGTLELWCKAVETDHRWQLQFDVRQEVNPEERARVEAETLDQSIVEAAQDCVRRCFSNGGDLPPEKLMKALREVLERQKNAWPLPVIRQIADTLIELDAGRRISAAHEARYLNLLGFCLRPGYGDAVDEWRMKQAWKVYPQGLAFPNQGQCRSEWWVFWRRVAGGLTPGKQQQVFQQIMPQLQAAMRGSKKKNRRINAQEALEIWMALATFERLLPDAKVQLGRLLLEKSPKQPLKAQELWALSRLGTQQPVYGGLERLVPVPEATDWIEKILVQGSTRNPATAHSLAYLARKSQDQTRDIPTDIRDRVISSLQALENPDHYVALINDADHHFSREEEKWIYGESLPAGLSLFETLPDER